MRARILGFAQGLRDDGLAVSVAESLDAVEAVAAAGVERDVLREALAATLVKDEADRAAFDARFEVMFPAVGRARVEPRKGRRGGGQPAGSGATRGARGSGGVRPAPPRREEEPQPQKLGASRTDPRGRALVRAAERREEAPEGPSAFRGTRRRILALPFREYTALDLEEAHAVARELAARLRGRLARRTWRARRGRLDFRRTIRSSISAGGVPARLRFRTRRPGRPDLVVLCDLSRSVAEASGLLLALLAPLGRHFRRVQLFAYVDRLCPVTLEGGHVVPDGPLDLHARSDLGRVLVELAGRERVPLGRSTELLVLGDARNNRLPPRADVLRALRDRVQRLVWLVPEPRGRWNTGDSVLALYAPACDAVVECVSLAELVRALRRTL
jgi:uncharacterized protein with von Willebrand factor type A (vWA) domain